MQMENQNNHHTLTPGLVLFFIAVVVFFMSLFIYWQINQQLKKAEAVYNTIYAFLATATEEEYDEITEELRHSLVLRTLTEDDLPYLDLIPNTAADCPLDRNLSDGLYLVALNTGALYSIDPARTAHSNLRFGYDEVSQSRILLDSQPGTTAITLTRDGGEVSIQRMKGIFCEDCFSSLVETLTKKNVLEFVLYAPSPRSLSPITEAGEYIIGDFSVSILRKGNDYEITADLAPS